MLCKIKLRVDERSSAGYWASHPRGLHNPIFWALILLNCLEASQTHTRTSYRTIMANTNLPLRLRHPNRPCYHPLLTLKKPQGVGFSSVAWQYQIHEVLFTKMSIWHQRVLLGDYESGDIILHLMNRGATFACGTMDCEGNVSQRQSSEIVYQGLKSYEVLVSEKDCLSSFL